MPLRFNLLLRTRSRVTGAAINPCVNQLETLINKQELRSQSDPLDQHSDSLPVRLPVTLSSPQPRSQRRRFGYICAVIGRPASSPRPGRSVSGGAGCQSLPRAAAETPERGRCQRLSCSLPSVALVGFSSQHGHSCLQPLHPAQLQPHDPPGQPGHAACQPLQRAPEAPPE